MVLSQPLILIGPPAAGKSAVGKEVARRLTLSFFDLDELIVKSVGLSIAHIFEKHGENYFRVLETQTLRSFSQRKKPTVYVMACGGGTALSPKNREILKKEGTVIYLKPSVVDIASRIQEEMRPIFFEKSTKKPTTENAVSIETRALQEKIRIMLNTREPYYIDSADWVIETAGKSIRMVSEEIVRGEIHGKT